MTENKWNAGELRSLFTRVNRIRTDDGEGTVVAMPISWDVIEKEIREATNELVACEAEMHRIIQKQENAATRLRNAQTRLIERLSHLGIKGEIVDRTNSAE